MSRGNDVLGPLTPIWWENVTLARALRRDEVSCYFGVNFLKPIVCPSPSVVVVHDFVHRIHPEAHTTAYRWYLRTFLPRSIQTADRIVVVSENTKRDLLRLHDVPEDRVVVAPPAAAGRFELRELSPNERTRLRGKYDLPKDFLLFVGNIEPRKNLTTLLKAVRALPEDLRLPLVVVGQEHVPDPELRTLLDAEWTTDLVYFPGYVPDEDLALLYNLATVFVYPSVYEGFGIPPLEAMQSGTPVVTSDRSSLPEVVGDAGVTTDPSDTNAVTDAIAGVLADDQHAATLRQRGLDRATEFSWDATGRIIQETIESAIREAE